MKQRNTRGALVLLIAQSILHRDTYERVVLPAIADLQHECVETPSRLVRMRAFWGVLKTLALCIAGDAVRDRDRHTAALTSRLVVILAILVVLLTLPVVSSLVSLGQRLGPRVALIESVLLTPSNLAVALPCALFLALALHRRAVSEPIARLLPTAAVVGTVAAAIMVAMVTAIVPIANQNWQRFIRAELQTQEVTVSLTRGVAEMTWWQLGDHIRHAPSRRAEELARGHRQGRSHMVASVFVLAMLGLGLAGRWRSRAATVAAAIALLGLYVFCFTRGWNNGGRPLAFWVWSANVTFFVLGVGLIRSRSDWMPA
jgi:hypothetical protein